MELQAQRVVEGIKEGFRRKRSQGLAYAFDRIWREGLVYKMQRLGIHWNITQLIDPYLQSRTFQIKMKISVYNKDYSARCSPRSNTFSNDILTVRPTTHFYPNGGRIAQFANDTMIMPTCKAEKLVNIWLQRYVDQRNWPTNGGLRWTPRKVR